MIQTVLHTAQTDSLTGVVLAGGLSTRMGNDKAGIHLYGDHEPDLLARTCSILSEHVTEVWISGRPGKNHNTDHLWLPDEVESAGPIGGIMTALRAAQGPVLMLSCDLPFMDGETIAKLVAARNARTKDTLMTTFLQAETGFVEALVAIYEFAALPLFEDAVEKGHFKISRVVSEKQQHHISYSSEESLPFFNVNYPADLEMARRIIRSL